MRKHKFLFLLLLLYGCKDIDNPISLIINNKNKEIIINNELKSNIKNINIDISKISLKVGEEKKLLAITTFKDTNTESENSNIIWDSDDKKIAIVSNDGILKGISIGETGITVRYKNDNKVFRILVKVF